MIESNVARENAAIRGLIYHSAADRWDIETAFRGKVQPVYVENGFNWAFVHPDTQEQHLCAVVMVDSEFVVKWRE